MARLSLALGTAETNNLKDLVPTPAEVARVREAFSRVAIPDEGHGSPVEATRT